MIDKPEVRLTESDGNAFALIGKCTRAAKKADWTPEQIKEFRDEAMSGDYQNVLRTCCKYFDVS
jgi:hypothetical protein